MTKQGAKLGRLINEQLVNAAVVLGTFMCCSDCKDQEIEKKTFLQIKLCSGSSAASSQEQLHSDPRG